MQMLANIAFGALVAAASLGPAAWADIAQINGAVLHTAAQLARGEAGVTFDHAVAKARAALPDLPHGAH